MKVKNLEETFNFYRNLFDFKIKQENNPNKSNVPSIIIGNESIKLWLYEVHRTKPEDYSDDFLEGYSVFLR